MAHIGEGHAHHHHHEYVHSLESLNTVFIVAIVLNLSFVAVEAGVGFTQNSLGLLSDAGHNLGDVFSLLLALIAFKLAKIGHTRHFTYGYKKSTVLISLLNAIILLVAVGAIVIESIHKFASPEAVNGAAVSWTAGVGIVVNGLTAWMLMKNQKHDINVRGAFLHMAADTLVSVGVVISGVVISVTGLYVIDPVISLCIAVIILVSTWRLLSESLRMSLDGIPDGVDMDKVKRLLESVPHVQGVHHIHVWAISTTENALTAHVVIDDLNELEDVKGKIKEKLRTEAGVQHSTIEVETPSCHCHNMTCD